MPSTTRPWGGLSGLVAKIDPKTLRLMPDFGDWGLALSVFVIPIAVQWWSVWYPGAEPGGGSYIAQRMLAARDEKHSMGATLWFNVAHYGIRPWPWILVALCSFIVYPTLQDIQRAFPHVSPELIGNDIAYPAMLRFLPSGWLGLMVASLLAAYLSTIETHLNWGASYLVNDFYRRFMRPGAPEKHLVFVSRLVTAGLMVCASAVVFFLDTARESFDLMLSIGAGTGLIYILRWFWWRINAWSEIAAMISSFAVAMAFFIAGKAGAGVPAHIALISSVGITTAVWVAVTYLTRPFDRQTLVRFYRLVRPFGRGWAAIRHGEDLPRSPDRPAHAVLGWVLGCALVYSALFGTGNFLYGKTWQGVACLVPFALSAAGLVWVLNRMFREERAEP